MTFTASQSSEEIRPPERTFALGLGLTNECNLACSFCYRDPARTDRLSLSQVHSVMESLPVRSVNLGTGENGMHPEFAALLEYLRRQSVKLTITSNGYSTQVLDDAQVVAFKDVEFSLDYPNEAEQDRQRGAGNWRLIHEQAARCRRLGVPVTFIAVMMRSNFDRLADVAEVARAYDAPLRINVYQSVRSDAYSIGRGAARRSTYSLILVPISSTPIRSPPRAPSPRRAKAAVTSRPAAAAAPAAGAWSKRSIAPILIARWFAAKIARSRFAWRQAANFPSSKALAPRSLAHEHDYESLHSEYARFLGSDP